MPFLKKRREEKESEVPNCVGTAMVSGYDGGLYRSMVDAIFFLFGFKNGAHIIDLQEVMDFLGLIPLLKQLPGESANQLEGRWLFRQWTVKWLSISMV